MVHTEGIAFFAASARLAIFGAGTVSGVSCTSTTLFLPANRASRSGRRVATTNSAATQTVATCAKSNQNRRSMAGGEKPKKALKSDYKRPVRRGRNTPGSNGEIPSKRLFCRVFSYKCLGRTTEIIYNLRLLGIGLSRRVGQ